MPLIYDLALLCTGSDHAPMRAVLDLGVLPRGLTPILYRK
jgi:hypothetical protein